ncbi:MAG: alkyl sulfatase dimerization domain-containing protein [bacterium]
MTKTTMKLDAEYGQTLKKNEAFQVILKSEVAFEQPHPDVHVAKIPIASASWVNTSDGTVLVDTLLNPGTAKQMKTRLEETGGRVKTIIYTHHHGDHVGGGVIFEGDRPRVIAHRYLPENMEKYELLKTHRARLTTIQFNVPFDVARQRPFLPPTELFDHEMVFTQGDKTFELYHARAETDDATWVYVPEIKTALVGDLIIAGLPNIGNPYKPTRFGLHWVRALEKVRAKQPQLLIAHGGRAVYQGKDVRELLDITIEGMVSLLDQVFEAINNDIPLDEMIHQVQLPPHLIDHPYLKPIYSRMEFAVYNIYRWYHGYFDHNPAHLLPRPDRELNREIIALIDNREKILERADTLHKSGQTQLALQILDILLKDTPEFPGARELHLALLEKLCETDICLMSRNTWIYFIEKDREILKARP